MIFCLTNKDMYINEQLFHHDKITNSWKRISNENC